MPKSIARTRHGCFVCTACGEPASSEDIEWDECSVCGGEGFQDHDAADEFDGMEDLCGPV